ncbi:MAG: hypothetical protein ABJQ26_14490, partial [Maricaulis sp.]
QSVRPGDRCRRGRLVALFADGTSPVRSAYHIVTARNRPLSPDAEAFIAWLRGEARVHEHSVDEL